MPAFENHITSIRYRIILLLIITGLLAPLTASSQIYKLVGDENVRTRILFLLDASGSMQNKWSDQSNETKMGSAKKILIEIIDSLDKFKNVEIGLRVYGHQSPPAMRNCKDTQLEVGFGLNSSSFIKAKLRSISPTGITPIAYSLEKAGEDFPNANGRNVIILMTDGEESCEGDPCEVSLSLEKKGIVLKHFVIGIGVEESAKDAFDCIGSYYQVRDQYSLKNVLGMIITRIINKTTTQVDLLDKSGNPTVTDINMTFYNSNNQLLKYNFYHTLNSKGLPDTLLIDPVTEYDMILHTLPPLKKENISLTPNTHNHIKINVAQGDLEVLLQGKTLNNSLNNKIKCVVRSHEDGNIINVQNFNTKEKYLVGKYDLEILTLPRTYLKNVDISQNKTTTIELPTPGIANIQKKYEVYGGIFITKNGKLEKIYELAPEAKLETLALHPGKYLLLYRSKFSKTMYNSKTIEFEINSGESISLNL